MQNLEIYRRGDDASTPHTIYENLIRVRPLREFVDEYTFADGRVIEIDAREYHEIIFTPKQTPQAKYDSKNTVAVTLKLNRKTDADIIKKLDNERNKQGYIKQLIRFDIENR